MKKRFLNGVINRATAAIIAASLTLGMTGCGSTGAAGNTASSQVSVAESSAVTTASAETQASGSSTEAGSSTAASTETAGKPSKDRSGNEITVPDTINAIISLSPAETEMLCDLGLGDKIIACDTYSPQYVTDLPDGIPQLDMMSPDCEKIVSLKPDIVFTSGMSSSDGTDAFASGRQAGVCVADIPSSSSISASWPSTTHSTSMPRPWAKRRIQSTSMPAGSRPERSTNGGSWLRPTRNPCSWARARLSSGSRG